MIHQSEADRVVSSNNQIMTVNALGLESDSGGDPLKEGQSLKRENAFRFEVLPLSLALKFRTLASVLRAAESKSFSGSLSKCLLNGN